MELMIFAFAAPNCLESFGGKEIHHRVDARRVILPEFFGGRIDSRRLSAG